MGRGGGLLFYVRNTLVFNTLFDNVNTNFVLGDIESMLISVHLKETLPIYIVGIYRPPSGKIDEYVKKCDNIIESIYMLPKGRQGEIMILGDVNIDLLLSKKCRMIGKVTKFCNKFSLKQLVKEPTRLSNKSSLIDHFYTNSYNISFCSPLPINVSDHLPIGIIRKKKCIAHSHSEFTGRSYIRYTKELFRKLLNDQNWDLFYSLRNVNDLWELMLKYITMSLDKIAPIRKFKFRIERPIWFSDELMETIKDKDTLMQRALLTKDEIDVRIARQARNRANCLVREAKASYIREQFDTYQHSPKKFWQNVKNVLPDSNVNNLVKLSDDDGLSIPDDKTAFFINNYFVNVGKKLVQKLKNPASKYDPVNRHQYNGYKFRPVQKEELSKLINLISIYKSSGIDNASSNVLKDAFSILIDQLLFIMNKSIKDGVFPDAWKRATVIPLPKLNNPCGVSDYRPISLLPLPGKLLEKLLHTQLIGYLENNNLLNEKQNGFRKKHNTSDTVFKLVHDLTGGMNARKHTSAVFVDFAKAFDTIDHTKLINKLRMFSVHTDVIDWFYSYLLNRKQRVMVNGKYSEWDTVEYGVPQGSILGPLLFIMYTNDLTKCIRNSEVLLYADDTVIYRCDTDTVRNYRNIQGDLNRLYKWCNQNGLTINSRKTKVIDFGKSRKKVNDLHINKELLVYEKQYKYLGVILDHNLNFEPHYKELVKTFSFKMYLYRRIRYCLNDLSAKMILKSMVLSYLDYGSMFFTVRTIEDIANVQILQNKALRACLRIKNYMEVPVHELHLRLNVQPYDKRMQYFLMCSIFRNIKNGFLIPVVPKKMTRLHRAPVLPLVTPNTDWYYKSAPYFGIQTWNILPVHVRNSVTLDMFKTVFKRYLFV